MVRQSYAREENASAYPKKSLMKYAFTTKSVLTKAKAAQTTILNMAFRRSTVCRHLGVVG